MWVAIVDGAAIVGNRSNRWQSSMWEQSLAIVDDGSNQWQSSMRAVIVDEQSLAIAAIDGNRREDSNRRWGQ